MIEHEIPGDAVAPAAEHVYRFGGFWNGIPAVKAEIFRRISGDPELRQSSYFHRLVGGRRFERGLFLACGNGRVEREFYEAGIVAAAVGIDISSELLEEATALGAGLPFAYHHMDMNQGVLPEGPFDLIVNVSAGHHVASVDRVFRAFAARLPEDGYFYSYDYVGPHRFQYPWHQWEAIWELNESLPEGARQKLAYAHMPTMLKFDPTEAVHPELMLATHRRYFTMDAFRPSGGALAYHLLTFNEALDALPDAERAAVVETVMRADEAYLRAHPESTLFAFWFGRPRKDVLEQAELLASWEAEETAREAAALRNGHRYYPISLLESVMCDMEGTGVQRSR